MIIGSCKVYLRAEWVYSLKGKRSVVKSLVEKIKNKFNVSIAEVERLDSHKTIVLGFCCVTNERHHASQILDNVIEYIENHTDADLQDVIIEIL